MIPIFDSISHPTIDANWILPKYEKASSILDLKGQMQVAGIKKTFAVGMKGIGSYDQAAFMALVKPYKEFILPIAYFDFNNELTEDKIDTALSNIKSEGFVGIKLHPRFSDFSLTSDLLGYAINRASSIGLVVLLCTYFIHNSGVAAHNNIETLCTLLTKTTGSRIILLHSGTTHLLDMIDVGRSYKNVLLDMSFTMCKYEGSSIDLDLKYAFKTFDQRICIGSDWPEFSTLKLRNRFEELTEGLSVEKKENIAYKNIENFIELNKEK